MLNKKFKIFLFIIFLTLILLQFFTFFSCNNDYRIIKEKRFLFDSIFEITIISNKIDLTKIDIESLFYEIENLGNKLDWRNDKSYISAIEENGNLIIPDEFKDFFNKIAYYYKFTEGYFNPFLRKLILAYNNFNSGSIPPKEKEIIEILSSIKKSNFIYDNRQNNVNEITYAKNLDLGAAVAGFLVDYSYNYLISKGYKNFLINGSGEIRVSGNKFGKNWLIGIQSPFANSVIDIIALPDGYSISTTGSYERYFIYNNQKYHHILNPFSGLPDSKLESVSIISKDSCLASDILSTAIFAMGIDKAVAFCDKRKIDYYIIYKNTNQIIIKKTDFFKNP